MLSIALQQEAHAGTTLGQEDHRSTSTVHNNHMMAGAGSSANRPCAWQKIPQGHVDTTDSSRRGTEGSPASLTETPD
ncbi:uncharacterized protein BBA_06402 [Beauveria bassiana ARSEF 2860]|uniref:Uncharacterized protein n=1 Tax=Beauveria bassiana (strain ARSEF 2860) TaxID=655819 RepID=J5JGK4_BEAB2|nr:uncharacterized protein BBA_06402 [Beauveria bassiana ARSEF 2860]EJP64833.1 hypothetical protein BBA_06402 [Beauveria bassiana ARSEF 2860]